MSSSAPVPPWSEFTEDPRTPRAATLRASDRDREVVLSVLTEAYADGRLDREEHDQRSAATQSAKTLGGLAELLSDLVPQAHSRAHREAVALAGAEERQQQAVRRWESRRAQAVASFLIPNVACWGFWLLLNLPTNADGDGLLDAGLPWPLFVMLFTGIGLLRVLLHKREIIAAEHARLERRALGSRQRRGPQG